MKRLPSCSKAGFTMFEVLLAAVLAMILMFGALFSTGESYSMAREADKRLHTHVAARKSMDTMLKQIRYSAALAVTGDAGTGWTIVVETTESLNPGELIYTWDPNAETLVVTDGTDTDSVVTGVQGFNLVTETVGADVSRVTFEWTLEVDAGGEAGVEQTNETLSISGSTWVQRFAPMN